MSYDEELKAKYGRNGSAAKSNENNAAVTENSGLKQEENSAAEKITVNLEQDSAQNLIERQITDEKRNKKIKTVKPDTPLVKFLKIIVYIAIISTVLSIITAFIARTDVNTESETVIEQIKKAEDLYFGLTGRYCYFSKTKYNETLGVDLSKRKYFVSYEVVPNIEFGNYEVKLYGATNAFTITYYVIKNFIVNKD